MRGKKVDSQFVSDFIASCVTSGYDTPEKIIQYTMDCLSDIDNEIKRVEELKIRRSKLVDVISTLDKPVKPNRSREAQILGFFKIKHPEICQALCDALKSKAQTMEDLVNNIKHPRMDVLFCIKQLLEHKVIFRSGEHLLRGEAYDTYLKFVLKGE